MGFTDLTFVVKDPFTLPANETSVGKILVTKAGTLLAFVGTWNDSGSIQGLTAIRVYRSTDGGEIWTLTGTISELSYPLLTGDNVWQDSADDNIYLFLHDGDPEVWIYKSTDDGATWVSHATHTLTGRIGYGRFFFDLGAGTWLGLWKMTGDITGIYSSTDQGANWTQQDTISSNRLLCDAIKTDTAILFVDSYGRFYRALLTSPYAFSSTTEELGALVATTGGIFTRSATSGGVRFAIVKKAMVAELLALKSADGGATWTAVAATGLRELSEIYLSLVISNDRLLVVEEEVGRHNKVWGSDDLGETFSDLYTLPEWNYGTNISAGSSGVAWVGMDYTPSLVKVTFDVPSPTPTPTPLPSPSPLGSDATGADRQMLLRWSNNRGQFVYERQIPLGDTGDTYPVHWLRRLGIYRTRQWEIVCASPIVQCIVSMEEDAEVLA